MTLEQLKAKRDQLAQERVNLAATIERYNGAIEVLEQLIKESEAADVTPDLTPPP